MRILYLCSLICLLLASGCNRIIKPDLERLYATARSDVRQPPVILIPGIMGSRLANAEGEEQWIGHLLDAAFSRYEHLALPIDPQTLMPLADGLQVSGLTDEFAGRDFYQSILRVLESAGGYRPAQAGEPAVPGQRSYYVFTYDWRQDNVRSAQALSQFIEQIRRDHNDPELMVDIIAHSMGGLITRYYLRYGEQDVLDSNDFPLTYHGADKVRRVVLLGTPNLGSVNSLHAFIQGRKVGFRRIPTEVLATFPSLYQLFPHPLNDWIINDAGQSLERDLFDVRLWRRFQWSIFDPRVQQRMVGDLSDPTEADEHLRLYQDYFARQLERARRFVWSLTVKMERTPWKLVVYGGDCTLTPARVLVEEVEGASMLRLYPEQISQPRPGVDYDRLMMFPGDGAVTKASLLARESLDPFVPRHQYSFFPIDYPIFLCEQHDALTTNAFFQDNLLHFLLSIDVKQ
ncbi:MAG: hypothetical protein Tsb002_35200 [Wenzhouxiangellaceae bacterium]